MHALFVSLLATIPFGTLVGAHRTMSRSRHRNVARQSTNKTYVLEDFYQADAFFSYVSVPHVPGHVRSEPLQAMDILYRPRPYEW
jgi:hypothetical protein